jgi:NTP pyrophosphatase (non-canonical NTP hydrolase)
MDIKELKSIIEQYATCLEKKFGKYEDKEKLILSSTVKLSEELGELCDEVLKYNSRQRKEKYVEGENNLADEFADVILATFMLAKDMDIDLELALKNKIKKLNERFNL